MHRLTDHGSNAYSQGGEDGIIRWVWQHMADGPTTCVEFGAADGTSCSNTAHLWREGWDALLIEADEALFKRCRHTALDFEKVTVVHDTVRAEDPSRSIDEHLDRSPLADREIGVMSVDVDGDDFWIVCGMVTKPRVLIVEYNPTVPPHLDLMPAGPGNHFGVGAATLRRALELRGYTFIGLTDTNCVFVRTDLSAPFSDLETDMRVLMPPERFMYVTTDYQGRMVPAGARPSWGLRWPESETRFVANQPDLLEVETYETVVQVGRTIIEEIRLLKNP